MIPSWLIITCSILYIAILFAVAYYFERRRTSKTSSTIVYSLSLAVFCTSWAFYGTIQQAAMTGWYFAPTYIGTILLLVFGWRFLQKLVSISKLNQITSVSDFISSRYGKSQKLAGGITFIALVATIPYIALQLKALTTSYLMITETEFSLTENSPAIENDSALYITLTMALFSILFGTRRVDATEHQNGIIHAIAFESIVKLIAFLALGIYICFTFFNGIDDIVTKTNNLPRIQNSWQQNYAPLLFWTHALLGLLAIFCLPRQFHVLVVENKSVNDIKPARWVFGGYLLLINLFVLPIGLAGLIYFNSSVPPDTYILAFPLSDGSKLFSLIAYIGGFSAATSMIIIVSIVLSTMVSNDLVTPALFKLERFKDSRKFDVQSWLLNIRRVIIFVLLLLAFLYYRTVGSGSELASIGLLSMSLVAQFAPAIIGGLYWKKGNRKGVIVGLSVGLLVWAYTLLIPALASAGYLNLDFLFNSELDSPWLSSSFLLGAQGFDQLTVGVFWSLLLNTLGYIFGSINTKPSKIERSQAIKFVSPRELSESDDLWATDNTISKGELFELCERFIGKPATAKIFFEQLGYYDSKHHYAEKSPMRLIDECQKALSRVIGGSSSQIVIDTLSGKTRMELHDVVDIVDEASQVFTFNRELLHSAMENISHGISVIDKDLKLVAWNKQYQRLFDYPEELLNVGRPIEDLIRFNAEQGVFGDKNIEKEIQKRLDYLRQGKPHTFERNHNNGVVLKIQGNPMPGGGFVTAFIDITELRQKQEELARINTSLEDRVNTRTQELLQINQQLDFAKQSADRANRSKTRFLAAASHDILQPINAASLLTDALYEKADSSHAKQQLELIGRSLSSADELLSDLLEISKLDAGVIYPRKEQFALQPLLKDLCDEFQVIAEKKQLRLNLRATNIVVESDPTFLRRILQNLISNAIRYTNYGRVLIAVRKHGDNSIIYVFDTGIGIKNQELSKIFEEFTRLEQHSAQAGHGLGLAIVQRYAQLLEHEINISSRFGSGSCFSIKLPSKGVTENIPSEASKSQKAPLIFEGTKVLVVDNDPAITQAMEQLLVQWGMSVVICHSLNQVKNIKNEHQFDLLLLDNHLDNHESGFDVLNLIRADYRCAVIVITADRSEEIKRLADENGIPILFKPVKSFKLRTLIKNQLLAFQSK